MAFEPVAPRRIDRVGDRASQPGSVAADHRQDHRLAHADLSAGTISRAMVRGIQEQRNAGSARSRQYPGQLDALGRRWSRDYQLASRLRPAARVDPQAVFDRYLAADRAKPPQDALGDPQQRARAI